MLQAHEISPILSKANIGPKSPFNRNPTAVLLAIRERIRNIAHRCVTLSFVRKSKQMPTTSTPSVTFFTTCKPFNGEAGLLQTNALSLWKSIDHPKLLLGDEAGARETAEKIGATHLTDIRRNDKGIPLISSLFEVAARKAQTDYLCYVNADIFLRMECIQAIEICLRGRNADAPLLATGRRKNIPVAHRLDENLENCLAELDNIEKEYGCWDHSSAIDLFVYNRSLFADIPDFAIGYMQWDNWLVWKAKAQKADVIDFSLQAPLLHPVHGYSSDGTGLQERSQGRGAAKNRALARGNSLDLQTATTHVLTYKGVEPINNCLRAEIEQHCKPQPQLELRSGLAYLHQSAQKLSLTERCDSILTILDRAQYFTPRVTALTKQETRIENSLTSAQKDFSEGNIEAAAETLQDLICYELLSATRSAINSDRPLLIWGAGQAGRRLTDLLARHGLEPKGFIDSDASKSGHEINGLRVITNAPPQLNGAAQPFILIASMYANEMVTTLMEMGYVEENDFAG